MRAETEKMLGANLPDDFVEAFWAKAFPPNSKSTKTDIVTAMANLWLDKSDAEKEYYLTPGHGKEHQSLVRFIENIVEKKINEFTRSRVGAAEVLRLAKARAREQKQNQSHSSSKVG